MSTFKMRYKLKWDKISTESFNMLLEIMDNFTTCKNPVLFTERKYSITIISQFSSKFFNFHYELKYPSISLKGGFIAY